MKTVLCYLCLFLYVGANSFAVMNIKSEVLKNVYFIHFDDYDFNQFNRCLTNSMTESCKLCLKLKHGKNYKIKSIEENSLMTEFPNTIPVFACSFPPFFGHYLNCLRKPILYKNDSLLSAFAFVFEHDDEFFIHDTLKNMSIGSKTFVYSLSQDRINTLTPSLVDTNDSSVTDATLTPITTTLTITASVVHVQDTTVNTTSVVDFSLSTGNNFGMDRDEHSGAFISYITISVIVGVSIIVVFTVILLRFFKRKKKQSMEKFTESNVQSKSNVQTENNVQTNHVCNFNRPVREASLGSVEYEQVYTRLHDNMTVLTNEYGELLPDDNNTEASSAIKVNQSLQEVSYHNSKVKEKSFDSDNCQAIYSKLHDNKTILTNEYGDLLHDDNNTEASSVIEVNHSLQEVTYHNSKVTEARLDSDNCKAIYSKLHENKTILTNEYDDLQHENNNTQTLTDKYNLSTSSSKKNDNPQEMSPDSTEVKQAIMYSPDCEDVYSTAQENQTVIINEYDDLLAEYSNTVTSSVV